MTLVTALVAVLVLGVVGGYYAGQTLVEPVTETFTATETITQTREVIERITETREVTETVTETKTEVRVSEVTLRLTEIETQTQTVTERIGLTGVGYLVVKLTDEEGSPVGEMPVIVMRAEDLGKEDFRGWMGLTDQEGVVRFVLPPGTYVAAPHPELYPELWQEMGARLPEMLIMVEVDEVVEKTFQLPP
jgi:hypothetical protein